MKQIKVICIDSFQEFNQGKLSCEVSEGEELVAALHEDTEEYFSMDSKGREVYVGSLDISGSLVLDECFELVEEGADTE